MPQAVNGRSPISERSLTLTKSESSPLPRQSLRIPRCRGFYYWRRSNGGSQRHYVESVRDQLVEGSDPLYVDILQYHWIEENQHTKTDVLEIEQLARALSPDELSTAFDTSLPRWPALTGS